MRKLLIAANWKMYKTPTESTAFLTSFYPLVKQSTHAEILLCPAMTSLPALVDAARSKPVFVGAQNMHWKDEGAFTGETSPVMLTAIGATHVLIGHSERRQYFNETDTTVNHKLKAALAHSLIPIVCVGEKLEEREAGLTRSVLELQTSIALEGIDPAIAAPIVFAYEPVWAIGTGRTATPEIAAEAHKLIRAQIAAPRPRRLHPHPLRRLRQTRQRQIPLLSGGHRRRSRRRRQPRPPVLRRDRPQRHHKIRNRMGNHAA